jgi:TRAP-type C4-dicarboxylate transport system permease small subunit
MRLPYKLACALGLAYVAWVLIAFAAARTKTVLPFRLKETQEFLLVLAMVASFVWGLAQSELEKNPVRQSLLQILDENLERYAMLIAYVFVCIVIVQEVVRRFGLNFSSAWAQETAQYLFIYLGYIGTAYAVKERAHIRFDIVLNKVSPSAKTMLYIVGEFATLLFALIAIYWSGHTVMQLLNFGGTTPVLRVNKTWFEMAVPLGFVLVVFRCLQAIKRDYGDLKAGRPAYAGKAMFEE